MNESGVRPAPNGERCELQAAAERGSPSGVPHSRIAKEQKRECRVTGAVASPQVARHAWQRQDKKSQTKWSGSRDRGNENQV